MRSVTYVAVGVLALTVAACGKKQEETEVVPPGFCKTEAECQPMADRENARQEELRQKRIAQGVHEQRADRGSYQAGSDGRQHDSRLIDADVLRQRNTHRGIARRQGPGFRDRLGARGKRPVGIRD